MTLRFCLIAAVLAIPAAAQMPAPPPQVPLPGPAGKTPSARPAASAKPAAGASYKDLKYPAPRPLEALQPARFQLSNGLKVLLVEDHERPMVAAEALVRTGAIFEPPDRIGVSALMGTLLRSGGSAKRSPESIDANLDLLGATIDSVIGETSGTVTLSVLKENAAEALPLFRDILTAPDFRHDRIDRAKALAGLSTARRNDDPRAVAYREMRSLLFGKDGPLTRRPDAGAAGRIGRPDVLAFYRRYFFPANVTLAISGDFDTAAMKGALESLFGGWKNDQPPVGDFPKVTPVTAPGGFLVFQPALKETSFAIGISFTEAGVAERAALDVAAGYLGGGVNGRLVRRAQAELPVVRDVRADWVEAIGRPGMFLISGFCQSPSAAEVMQMALEEVKKLGTAETTEDEIRSAREVALTRLVSGLDLRPRALFSLAHAEYYGYPVGHLPAVYAAIGAVTRADVLRVAKERLQPEKMTVLAVSNLTAWTKPLDPRGGAVQKIDISIPPAPAESTAANPGAAEVGKKLLARAQEASGGVDKLLAVKDFSQTASYNVTDGSHESQTDRWVAPSHLRQDAQSNKMGAFYRYTDGTNGWLSNGRGSAALTGLLAMDAQAEVLRVYVQLLVSDRLPGRTVVGLDDETVEVAGNGARVQVVFDPQTGLPAKTLYDVVRGTAHVFVEEEYSDFREVSGIKVPFGISVTQNGVPYSTGVVTEFKINQGLKVEDLIRRP